MNIKNAPLDASSPPRGGVCAIIPDQREVHRQIFDGDETIDYAWGGIRTLLTTDGFAKRSKTRYQSSISLA
jgi:hypothetical protein